MISLSTLGGIGLTGEDGLEHDGLLRQPKRLALLCYLASPAPGTWHRRDAILAAFWPEFESGKARTALRNALYVIRQELGADILLTRGDEEVSVNPAALASDLTALQEAITGDDFPSVVRLYRGEFLAGLFVNEAQGFEHWLDGERLRLRTLVSKAGARHSLQLEAGGNLAGAIEVQRWLSNTDPDDEASARRLITLYDLAGDRGQALAAFERLQSHFAEAFESEPSAETMRLVDEIRQRRSATAPRHPPAPQADVVVHDDASLTAHDSIAPVTARADRRWRWLLVPALIGAVVLAVGFGTRPRAAAKGVPTTLLVVPMENATGHPEDDYIATGLAEDVAARLAALRSFTIKSAARSRWPKRTRDNLALVAPHFGTQIFLRTTLTRVGDSLRADAELVDVGTGFSRAVGTEHFTSATLADAGSQLAALIAGAVFRVPLAEAPRSAAHAVDPEAYRLTLLGWHQLLAGRDDRKARELFLQATKLDPLYARAWAGLSSTWSAATTNGQIPFDEGYALAEAAATRALTLDSLQGSAWATLGVIRALKQRSLAAGEPYLRRAIELEPTNAEIYMVDGAVLRFAWHWDRARDAIRIARQLDPLAAYYAGLEGNSAMCQDKPLDALKWYRSAVALDAGERVGQLGVARALARLRRWDEAIEQLRVVARSRSDTALALALRDAHGERGYWDFKHREGATLLATRIARAGKEWQAPYLLGVAEIGAGQIDQGFDLIESEVRAGSRMVWKLPCNPEIDEIRSMPRFQRLLQAAGALPP